MVTPVETTDGREMHALVLQAALVETATPPELGWEPEDSQRGSAWQGLYLEQGRQEE